MPAGAESSLLFSSLISDPPNPLSFSTHAYPCRVCGCISTLSGRIAWILTTCQVNMLRYAPLVSTQQVMTMPCSVLGPSPCMQRHRPCSVTGRKNDCRFSLFQLERHRRYDAIRSAPFNFNFNHSSCSWVPRPTQGTRRALCRRQAALTVTSWRRGTRLQCCWVVTPARRHPAARWCSWASRFPQYRTQ